MAEQPIPGHQRDAVLAALERLLGWAEIARSPQLARFLDYIVRKTLDGDEQSIKAYSIAVDVFGRPADFDPQSDPIVRVQARRLRSLLDQYYQSDGAGESIRISLPTGRYIPEFSGREPHPAVDPSPPEAAAAPRPAGLPRTWYALSVVTLLLALAALLVSDWGPGVRVAPGGGLLRPIITIAEFQNLSNATQPAPAVAGLAVELVTDLEQFGTIDVRYGPASEGDDDYVLSGIVRTDGGALQYSAVLTDSRSDEVIWNRTITLPLEQLGRPGVLDDVSRELSIMLGSPRGPLQAQARRILADLAAAPVAPNLYVCRVWFDLYREAASPETASRTARCLADLHEPEKLSAEGVAMGAILRFERTAPNARAVAEQVHSSLDRAIALAPGSGFTWEQRARFHEAQGELEQARRDYSSSIQLNPASSDALAAYARLLARSGELPAAAPLSTLALSESGDTPAWYHAAPALLALRAGDYQTALEHAEIYLRADRELGVVLALVAAQAAEDNAGVNRYLPQILDLPSFRASGILVRLRQLIADPVLLRQIRDILVAAGLHANHLAAPF